MGCFQSTSNIDQSKKNVELTNPPTSESRKRTEESENKLVDNAAQIAYTTSNNNNGTETFQTEKISWRKVSNHFDEAQFNKICCLNGKDGAAFDALFNFQEIEKMVECKIAEKGMLENVFKIYVKEDSSDNTIGFQEFKDLMDMVFLSYEKKLNDLESPNKNKKKSNGLNGEEEVNYDNNDDDNNNDNNIELTYSSDSEMNSINNNNNNKNYLKSTTSKNDVDDKIYNKETKKMYAVEGKNSQQQQQQQQQQETLKFVNTNRTRKTIKHKKHSTASNSGGSKKELKKVNSDELCYISDENSSTLKRYKNNAENYNNNNSNNNNSNNNNKNNNENNNNNTNAKNSNYKNGSKETSASSLIKQIESNNNKSNLKPTNMNNNNNSTTPPTKNFQNKNKIFSPDVHSPSPKKGLFFLFLLFIYLFIYF
jgi:hypothetical protein